MSPHLIPTEPRPLAAHPQRPWRRVESRPQRPAHTVARTYAAAVVRELPPRRAQREPLGTW
jgi:hypothetical protein